MVTSGPEPLAAVRDLLAAGRWHDALEAAQREALHQPTSPTPLLLAAQALHGLGRLPEALDVAEQAAALAPDRPDLRREQARLLVASGRHEEAAAILEPVAAHDASGQAAFELGQILATLERPETAAAAFEQATRQRSDWAEAYGNWGTALGLSGRIAESEKAFVQALALQPENGTWWYNLGLAHWARRRRGEARAAFARAIEAKPDLTAAVTEVLGMPLETAERRARLLRLLLVSLPLVMLIAWGLLVSRR